MANTHPLLSGKHTGILMPLFSMRSKRDWGIGDIGSLGLWLDFLKSSNLDVLEILPINEMPPGINCPYTSISAFAIDPIYVAIENIKDLDAEIKKEINSAEFRKTIKELRNFEGIPYDNIKKLKFPILWKIYESFRNRHLSKSTSLAKDYLTFTQENKFWLDDYALFRKIKDDYQCMSWTEWPHGLKDRDPIMLEAFKRNHILQIDFFKYLQWIIQRQWSRAKEKAEKLDIKLFGDLPFMVNQDSADIWARQNEFDISASIGAPPDAYSKTGQKWGLPAYRWHEIEKNNFEWWRTKVKKAEDFYHIYRLDHMVGFFRTWIVPHDEKFEPYFDIEDEDEQRARGKRFLRAVLEASTCLPAAEDLGLIPLYVDEVLKEVNVPGYKVMRWQKTKDQSKYIEPEYYDKISLATTSTHDNETLKEWWTKIEPKEKKLFWHMITGHDGQHPIFKKAHVEIIKKLLKAKSAIVILPIQDILGTDERVNIPNTMGKHNWSYRFPVDIEDAHKNEKIAEKIHTLKCLIKEERL
ncbi:MAG: 4-alpha-glucanotransferase [Elusimicrobiota bacterium]|nr:4-alpha-glucanotransferase [Elusimicrobiota bacterium]